MSVRRSTGLNLRALLPVLVVAAVALAQLLGVAVASPGPAAPNDRAPCQHMDTSPGDLQAENSSLACCVLHDGGGLDFGCDSEEPCAAACASPAMAFIVGTLAPAISVPDRDLDKIAAVSGSSAPAGSAAPPPRL